MAKPLLTVYRTHLLKVFQNSNSKIFHFLFVFVVTTRTTWKSLGKIFKTTRTLAQVTMDTFLSQNRFPPLNLFR